MVIKFDRDFVDENDPLRGHSIALFTKIYGDKQRPRRRETIDAPGKIPDVYRGADPRRREFEQELWNNFWKLAEDPRVPPAHTASASPTARACGARSSRTSSTRSPSNPTAG